MADSSKFDQLVKELPGLIGGVDNATYFTHCMTRLRINVGNMDAVKDEEVKKIKGVKGTAVAGNQFQIIIGTDVDVAYEALKEHTGLGKLAGSDKKAVKEEHQKFSIGMVFSALAGCMAPVLPVLIGGGMIKVLLLVLTMIGALSEKNGTFVTLNFAADAAFYFLPVFVAAASAGVFKMNLFVAMYLGAILIHPSFVAMVGEGSGGTFLGLPIYAGTYSSTMFPALLTVLVASRVERLLQKYSPNALRVMLVPFGTALIMTPVALGILAPIGGVIGVYLAKAVMALYGATGFFGIAVLSCMYPVLVMVGMHQGFGPYLFESFAETGSEMVLNPAVFVSNINIGAACLAVSLRTKASEIRQESSTSFVTACFAGVTEPGLFGIVMKYRRALVSVMIGNFVGAAIAGLFKTVCYAFAGSYGFIGLTTFLGGENATANFIHIIIAVVIGFAVTFVLTMILFKDDPDDQKDIQNDGKALDVKANITEDITGAVVSPMTGYVKPMEQCKDPGFAGGDMGKGVVMEPTEGRVFSPVNGTISVVFPTLHAIGILADNGAEMLVHVGIDTVTLNGEGFKVYVSEGDRVEAGQMLLDVDLDFIKSKGLSVDTPIIVTNSDEYPDMKMNYGNVSSGQVIMYL